MSARTDEDYSFDEWWHATHPKDSTSVRIKARIVAQVEAAEKQIRWNQPLIGKLLVPWDLSQSTFLLPAVEERMREFLPLAESVKKDLAPQLNWAPPAYKSTDRPVQKWRRARLSAVETPADGNCLLHAVSLCLWGQHDPGSVLRSLMRSIFEDKQSEKRMFDIWKEGQERADAAAPGMASFKMEQSQVVAEWAKLAEAAKGLSTYLSSFHAFVLANVLGRPIVILADEFIRGRDGEAYAPSDMRGIYLPTLKSANACYPTPIVIGYTCEAVGKVGHFTALVGVGGELGYIPLVDECGVGLPVRYGVPRATRSIPRPEEVVLCHYVQPTAVRSAESAKYLMALVHGVSMAPEAEEASRTLARKTADKFDWLRREQEKIYRQQGAASSSEGCLRPYVGQKQSRGASTSLMPPPASHSPPPRPPLPHSSCAEGTKSPQLDKVQKPPARGRVTVGRIAHSSLHFHQYLISAPFVALAAVVSWVTGSRWLIDRRNGGGGSMRSSASVGSVPWWPIRSTSASATSTQLPLVRSATAAAAAGMVVAAKNNFASPLSPTLSSSGLGSPPPVSGVVRGGFVGGRAGGSGGVRMSGNQTFSPKRKVEDELGTLGVNRSRTFEYTFSPGLGSPPPVSGAVCGGRAGGSDGVRMSGSQTFSPKRKVKDALSGELETLGVKRSRTIEYTSSPGLGSPSPVFGAGRGGFFGGRRAGGGGGWR